MKTAISLPDATFRRADAVAHRLGFSRSELYVKALEAYLGPPTDDEVTARLDDVYANVSSDLHAIGDTW